MSSSYPYNLNSSSDDIYEIAERAVILDNYQRYLYKAREEDFTKEEEERIRKIATLKKMTYEAVVKAVTSCEEAWVVIMHPSPTRQGYQEPALLAHLQKVCPAWDIKILPKAGPGALYLHKGYVLTAGEINKRVRDKSLDFRLISPSGEIIYGVAKYTKGDGGAQKNQMNDMLAFTKQQTPTADHKIIFFADGDYYHTKGKTTGKTRLEEVRDIIQERGIAHNTFAIGWRETKNVLQTLEVAPTKLTTVAFPTKLNAPASPADPSSP